MNLKIAEFTGGWFFCDIDCGNISKSWALFSPVGQHVEAGGLAFDDHFYAAIGPVSDPAGDVKALCLFPGSHAVTDALYAASDK